MTNLPHPSPRSAGRRYARGLSRVARLLALGMVPGVLVVALAAGPAHAVGTVTPDAHTTATATAHSMSPKAAHATAHTTATPDAVSAPAAEWSVVPADADGPDGRISLRHVIEPGETARDAIAVTNQGTEASRFSVAAGDGITGSGGAFDVSLDESSGSGTWISVGGLDDGALTLDAGQTRVLPVELSVPADATPGDHPAGIVVGISTDVDGVTVTHRVGVRVHLRVAGDIAAALDVTEMGTSFTPSWVPFAPGTLRVDFEVANTGNVRLGSTANVEAAGLAGALPAGNRYEIAEILPGDVARGSAEMTVWPLLALFGDVTITATSVGEDSIDEPPATAQSFTVAAVSWTGVAGLLLVGGLVVLLIARRRRRARREAKRLDEAVTAALHERERERERDRESSMSATS